MTERILGLKEFEEMSRLAQLDLLYRDGVYVGKRKVENQAVVLFQLYTFYVEVYYRKYRKEIRSIITSADTGILQPYLEQVHVRDLAKNKET
jgi:hypothetical protein